MKCTHWPKKFPWRTLLWKDDPWFNIHTGPKVVIRWVLCPCLSTFMDKFRSLLYWKKKEVLLISLVTKAWWMPAEYSLFGKDSSLLISTILLLLFCWQYEERKKIESWPVMGTEIPMPTSASGAFLFTCVCHWRCSLWGIADHPAAADVFA